MDHLIVRGLYVYLEPDTISLSPPNYFDPPSMTRLLTLNLTELKEIFNQVEFSQECEKLAELKPVTGANGAQLINYRGKRILIYPSFYPYSQHSGILLLRDF